MRPIIILARTIVFIVMLELCARCDDMIRFGADPWKPYIRQTTIYSMDKYGLKGKPNSRYQKWRLNNQGFRGRDMDLKKGAGNIRILCAGASETFGLYEDEGSEWPAQLERLLNKSNVTNIDVINTSFVGEGSIYHNIIRRFEEFWLKFGPDIFIIYASLESYLYDHVEYAGMPVKTTGEARIAFIDNFRIIGKAKDTYRKYVPKYLLDLKDSNTFRNQIEASKKAHGRGPLPFDTVKKRIEDDIVKVNGICKRNNIVLVLSSSVQRTDPLALLQARVGKPYFEDREIISIHYELNRYLDQLAAREHIIFVDNMESCAAIPRYVADATHLTNEGASVIANNFYHVIMGRILIRGQSRPDLYRGLRYNNPE